MRDLEELPKEDSMRLMKLAPFSLAGLLLASLLSAQTPEGPEILVNTRQGFPTNSQVAAANGGFVVTWAHGALTGPDRVWVRRFTSQGKPQGRDTPVDPSSPKAPQSSPGVAVAAGGNFIVVWEVGDTVFRGLAFGRCFTANGKALGPAFRLNPGSQDHIEEKPAIAATPDGGFVATWVSGPNPYGFESDDILARRFTANGKPLGAAFKVVFPAPYFQNDPHVAVSANGDFLIGWRAYPDFSDNFAEPLLVARRFDAEGHALGDKFQVAPSSLDDDNGFALVMTDDGEALFVWKGPIPNAPPDGSGFFPHGVLSQRFAADDRAIGSPVLIHEIQRNNSYEPPAAALLPGGGTFVAWSDGLVYPSIIFGQSLASDGILQGSVLQLNGGESSQGFRPAVAIARDGQGIVTWTLPLRRSTQILLRRLAPN
jgi:hypothetical protein